MSNITQPKASASKWIFKKSTKFDTQNGNIIHIIAKHIRYKHSTQIQTVSNSLASFIHFIKLPQDLNTVIYSNM